MAKKSIKAKAAKPQPKVRIIGIRANDEWASWVENLAETHRTTVAGLIDRVLTEWADAHGYGIKPPKRTG